MPVIDLKFNLEDASSGFEPVPADQYRAKIVKVTLGESNAGNAKLDVQWEIIEPPEFVGRKIFDTVPLHIDWRVKRYADIAGIESGSRLDTSLFEGAEAILTVSIEKSEGYDPKNQIKKIVPVD